MTFIFILLKLTIFKNYILVNLSNISLIISYLYNKIVKF